MSVITKKAGRPKGSGMGNYTTNPNQKRPGRGKLILTITEIEERKDRKRKRVLRCYYNNKSIKAEIRAKSREAELKIKLLDKKRNDKLSQILDIIKQKLDGDPLDDTDEEILEKLKIII